ncbi:MAG: hypothetical protein P8Y97_22620 [Candidatus Lokiarchaeota archaeon]
MTNNNLEEQEKEEQKEGEIIYLRSYSKAIFFFPLFFTTIILWLLQYFLGASGKPVPYLGFVWILVFFINLITVSFNISSMKFFILILIVVIVISFSIFFTLPVILVEFYQKVERVGFSIGMNEDFYMVITIILGSILLVTLIIPRFNYWRLERNEFYHKKGIFVTADRYPIKSLQFEKKIPDILEFFMLGAGSITLIIGNTKTAHLNTIVRIDNKAERIDSLLSEFEVEVEPDK